MTKVIRYIIYSKSKYLGKETTTGYEYMSESVANDVAKELDKAFPSYSHRVQIVSRVGTLEEE